MPGIENSSFSLFSFLRGSRSSAADSRLLSFDCSVQERMKVLYPPSISLCWLSSVLRFLSFVHHEAKDLINGLGPESGEEKSRFSFWYLADSTKFLDLLNVVNSEVENLCTRCMVLSCVNDIGQSRGDRVREFLSGEGSFCPRRFSKRREETEQTIRELVQSLGKEKSSGGVNCAVATLTVFFGGGVASATAKLLMPVLMRAPREFCWAESFDRIEVEVFAELERRFGGKREEEELVLVNEAENIEARMRHVVEMMDNGEKHEAAVRALLAAKDEMYEELGRLKATGDGLLKVVVGNRG